MGSGRIIPVALMLAAACGGGRNRNSVRDAAPGQCQGLACFQRDCAGQPATTLSGKVTAPNGVDPIAGALVYVPSGDVAPFEPGIHCEACTDLSSAALVTVSTGVDGSFVLANVPATTAVPVVVQKGRFRKQLTVDVAACQDQKLTAAQTRLPRKPSEGDLPRIAVGVGDYDQIECVLRSIGIDPLEFTPPTSTGVVHLYDNYGGAPSLESLLADSATLSKYNLVFVNCTGTTFDTYVNQVQAKKNILDYVSRGGRLYVTDWSYDYMEQLPELAPYVFFDGGGDMIHPQPPKAAQFIWSGATLPAHITDPTMAAWMKAVGASSDGNVPIDGAWALAISTAADQVKYPSTTWVRATANAIDRPMTVTFDYNACGRVLWSAYHTQEPGGGSLGAGGAAKFPSYCKTTTIPQEKILEYLIFEISSCVGPIG